MNYPNIFSLKEQAQERFNICKNCSELKLPLYQCNQCGCFMKIKVKIKNVSCPLQKW